MQEVFYEESAIMQNTASAKTKYYIFKTFSIISYVFAVIWLIFAFNLFPLEGNVLINLLLALIPFAIFLVSGIIFGRFKDKFYVDYDYTFVTGSVRISKVIKNVKRRKVLNFDTSNVEKIGKFDSATYKRYLSMPNKKLLILTSNFEPASGKGFYYIAVNVAGQKYLLVLECTETFLMNFLRFNGKLVFEDDFFKR